MGIEIGFVTQQETTNVGSAPYFLIWKVAYMQWTQGVPCIQYLEYA